MVKPRWFVSVFLLGAAAFVLLPAANADPVKKATEVTFTQPVEIPGMVLTPGTYVIKVPDPVTHNDMVGFYNRDESYLYKLVRTIPSYRLDTAENTIITFEERAGNLPQAVKTWFYPGDNWGKEFVYGNVKLATVAEEATIAPTPEPVAEAAAPAAEVEAAAEPVAEAAPAPVEIAEAAPAPAAEPSPVAPIEELPRTASSLPMIALIGATLFGAGVLLRLRNAGRIG